MQLPPLHNHTPAEAQLLPVLAAEGWGIVVIVKERHSFDESGKTRPVSGAVVRYSDEPWSADDPATSSIRFPNDIAPRKPTTDVLVKGDAISPAEQPVELLSVHLEVAALARSLSVFGPRSWYEAGRRLAPTDPSPFIRAPLRWENAFGGTDPTHPDGYLEEPRNPLGRGIAARPGDLLPQVEDPVARITTDESRPPPAGLAAIGPAFEPRRTLAGTHDEAWKQERMPLPPADFDERFYQCAPPEQQTEQPLRGGEPVRLLGMHSDGAQSFDLPIRPFILELPYPDGVVEQRATLDTVLLEPNESRLEMTWRAFLPWAHGSAMTPIHINLESLP